MSNFLSHLGWRLLQGVGVMFGAAALTFVAARMVPGDPAQAIAGGPEASPTPEVLAQIRAEYALDAPLVTQFIQYVTKFLSGDLGMSYRLNIPVRDAIIEQAWPTLALASSAALIAVGLSVILALATAGRNPVIRAVSSAIELTFASMPTFWLGLLLLTIFSYKLGWLPAISRTHPLALVLPALTLALPLAGSMTQVLRHALEEGLEQPFVLSARARGLGDWSIRTGHVLRHALPPYLTMAGYLVGSLLGGTVITEMLFNRQGIGKLLLHAVLGQDLPVVMGVVLLAALVFVTINLIVDLLHPIIDPRLRSFAQ
ncbi:peptide/nickel transport system permease protein [Ochrobactrum sp. 19YEA23]|uniref:ABC transporter permease n=1 Tax=Ochrobactrum sp. 19YEA23 TaxID=3039854 RepID=UPI0024786264|nr:peptide/nickel transport system permease protein [Ochrobactrum sp. 19YEA23]